MARVSGKAGTGRGRRAIIALALVMALLSGTAIIGPRLVPADRLAGRVAEALSAAAGAEVTVGSATVTLVGGPGLRLRDVQFAAPTWTATLTELDASLAVWPLLRRSLVVDRIRAAGPSASGNWRGLPAALTSFTLDVSALNLELPRDGSSPRGAGAPPGARLPTGLRGRATIAAARAGWSSFSLEQAGVTARLADRRLTMADLRASCGGGQVAGSAGLDWSDPSGGAWTGDVALRGVDAAALVGAWAPDVAPQLGFRLDGNVNAGGPLGPGAAPGLAATARLQAGEGLLRAGPWLADAAPYLGERQDLVDIRLRGARLAARLEGGRCLVDTLTLRGPDTDWDLGGAIDIGGVGGGQGAIDLAVHVRLPAGFTPQLGSLTLFAEAMRDSERRINLDLLVRGSLDEAAVTLDLAAMARRARRP